MLKKIQYFDFFDSIAINKYGRPINQIYLCHDNTLNTNYLSKIIGLLKSKGYQFISINDAINEVAYEQKYRYFKKWGISWFYRWINDQKERRKLIQQEPNIDKIYKVYENLSQ